MKYFFCILFSILLLSCSNKHSTTKTDETANKVDNNETIIIEKKEKAFSLNDIQYVNCIITNDYSVPNIRNRIIGINDDDPYFELPIKNHRLQFFWGGFFVILKNDISLEEDIILIAKNSKGEYNKVLNLRPKDTYIDDTFYYNGDILCYYEKIYFEDKFWLSDGNSWQIIVKSNNNTLINEEFPPIFLPYIIFEELNETPFIINNLRSLDLYKKYTYRSRKEITEIVVIYFEHDSYNSIFTPILYLIPDNNHEEYIEIEISWNDKSLKGAYYFGNYKINELPTEEKTYPLFASIYIH
jgi:hypothetical protein